MPSVDTDGLLDGDKISLGATHQVAGNPMRFHVGELDLRRDDAWRASFSSSNRWLVSGLTAPLMVRYGYLRRTNL
jgi:hypothetical protein